MRISLTGRKCYCRAGVGDPGGPEVLLPDIKTPAIADAAAVEHGDVLYDYEGQGEGEASVKAGMQVTITMGIRTDVYEVSAKERLARPPCVWYKERMPPLGTAAFVLCASSKWTYTTSEPQQNVSLLSKETTP